MRNNFSLFLLFNQPSFFSKVSGIFNKKLARRGMDSIAQMHMLLYMNHIPSFVYEKVSCASSLCILPLITCEFYNNINIICCEKYRHIKNT